MIFNVKRESSKVIGLDFVIGRKKLKKIKKFVKFDLISEN